MENHSETSGDSVNPWLSIWLNPRQTIREILDSNPRQHVFIIAIAAGFVQMIERASEGSWGEQFSLPIIILICLAGGALTGLALLYLTGWIFRWTGNRLGGNASAVEVRAAAAWSSIPTLWTLLAWIPLIVIFEKDIFLVKDYELEDLAALLQNLDLKYLLLIPFGLASAIIDIWSTIIFIQCLGEAHGFSNWRAFAAFVLGVILIIIVVVLIAMPFGLLQALLFGEGEITFRL